MYLIQHEVLSVEDADVAVSYGPGPRWGVMGPRLQWQLGGSAGGIKHFMDHRMDPLTAMIKTLGTPDVTPELKQTIVEGVLREAGNRSVDELAQAENELIIGLLRSRAQSENRTIKGKTTRAAAYRSTMNSIFNDPGFWHRLQFGFTIPVRARSSLTARLPSREKEVTSSPS